jgi:hypothetical protein
MRAVEDDERVPDLRPHSPTIQQAAVTLLVAASTAVAGFLGSHYGLLSKTEYKADTIVRDAETNRHFVNLEQSIGLLGSRIDQLQISLNGMAALQAQEYRKKHKPKPPKDE